MIELLMLDVRTLAFASSVSGFLMAATMLGIYLAGMRSRALIDWGAAGLAFGLGYLTGHILQTVAVIPMPVWVAGGLANALIGLGHGMLLIGVQRYLGRPCWTRPILIIVAIIFTMVFVFPEMRESLRLRVMVQSGFYVVVNTYAGCLLWRARRPGMRRFHRIAAIVMFAFACFLALRLGYAVISPALTTSFVQDPFQMGAFLAAMIFGFCITMALVVMMFREKQVELMNLAETDPLTGMHNRLSLDDIAQRHLEIAHQNNAPVSVMLVDVDNFKRINDEYGHQAGDKVLSEVAGRVTQVVRDSDTAFRIGGEEFLVLLPGAGIREAARVAERLRRNIAQSDLDADGLAVQLTASFGVVEYRSGLDSWEQLLKRADEALYKAKRGGRDRVVAPTGLIVSVNT